MSCASCVWGCSLELEQKKHKKNQKRGPFYEGVGIYGNAFIYIYIYIYI